ncbi:hypothetical protein AYI69_g4829 [Smittium culicis]|uniref:CCHC-type domain-containing protein n=1 Tax=Smittium culicis TaxID=133412 RepID=A0A1R1YAJ4_9FUNG|nr:hypothetical protein AYI69_g4829 [Smittium culicis]
MILNQQNSPPFIQISGIYLNLPTYSGKGDEISFPRWYSGCIDELKAFGFQNEEQAVLLLARQLRGNAKQIYNAYNDENQKITSIEVFKTVLEPKFIDDNYEIKLRYKLLNLKQTGSISKYIENEKDIFGNYKEMKEKDRIFYLMNNMKAPYLKILNKSNPKTYLEAINLIIKKGDLINMNTAMSGQKSNDSDMDIDSVEICCDESTYNCEHHYSIGVNLVSVDQRGKTFWVNIKEARTPVPLNTSHQITRDFLDKSKMCWNCGSKSHLRRDCKASDNHWRRKPRFNNESKANFNLDSGKANHQE